MKPRWNALKGQVRDKVLPWLEKAEAWPKGHLSERTFLIWMGLLIGVVSGLVAVLLKNMIYYFGAYVLDVFAADSRNFLLLVFPRIGITLTYIYVRYILKDNISHGAV
ncbi:MAG: hypothetical protein K2L79_04610 [Bacteroidales bacterium]|nr:hypothetical protein [Bacteroidales bacterium]